MFFLITCCSWSCLHPYKASTGNAEAANPSRNSLSAAVKQYNALERLLPAGQFARSFEGGQLKSIGSSGWVSGFYPGTLLYLAQYANDSFLLHAASRRLASLEKEQYNTHTHDLGFMVYCSFGNAVKYMPDSNYQTILINSARSLATRFNPTVGCIRSWDSDSSHFLVIIDNMMNLELLMYAFRQTGDSGFYRIAVSHANTTMQHHFRPDFSSYHVVDYNPRLGTVQKKQTHQGAADTSAWARGQAWGLYGFTMMYRETGNQSYLLQAVHIADFILHHPNLPADKIPYWDFNAPGIPAALRDASAGAVIASALAELAGYVKGKNAMYYRSVAAGIVKSLSSQPYRTNGAEAGGFLLKHSVGHMPNKAEVDVPLSYADYYYVEAMLRLNGKLPKAASKIKYTKDNND